MKRNSFKMFILSAISMTVLSSCSFNKHVNESGISNYSDTSSKVTTEDITDEIITTNTNENPETAGDEITTSEDQSSYPEENIVSETKTADTKTATSVPANKGTTKSSSNTAQRNSATSTPTQQTTTKIPVKTETETTAGVSVGNANTRISEQNKEIADNNKTEYVDTSNNSKVKKIYLSEGSTNYKYAFAYVTGNTILLNSTEKQVFAVVKPLIDSVIQTYSTDPEREKAIHDYIVSNCRYNIEACEDIDTMEEYNFHPDGVFLYHEAVCQGYAESFKLCMDLLGIQSDIVTGTGNGQAHAWNAVCLDNEWYQIDCTWDDPLVNGADSGRIYYTYFNITDTQMKKDHTYTCSHVCNGTKYNYDYFAEKEYGTIYTTVSDYSNYINSQLSAGNSTITAYVKCTDSVTIQDYLNSKEIDLGRYPASSSISAQVEAGQISDDIYYITWTISAY
jgi:transglutaminase/protease-like cytokinesis protein 3